MLEKLNKLSPVVALLALVTSIVVGGFQFWSSKVVQKALDASMSFGRIGNEVSWYEALSAYLQ
jgi:predicted negative regulator of RcsB-dependent stress response